MRAMAGIRVLADEHKVQEIRTLGRARDDDARRLLQAVALQVQPIMRRRRWRVPLLSEFSPRNPSLLGLNVKKGLEIKIRVRHHGRDLQFYSFEFLLGTMLHELAHIEHGPHDASFYKFLDEITKECEELMGKGITGTGQGFDLPGRRLGSDSIRPPPANPRKAALAAAEKRQQRGVLMPSGPQKLGGDTTMKNLLSPVQAAAMAAERRLRDDLWCAAPETVGGEAGFETAKEREETITTGNSSSEQQKPEASSTPEAPGSSWQCSQCTLLNPMLAPLCGACGGARNSAAAGSSRHWSCKFCSLDNPKLLERCAACNEWRYA